MKLTRFWFGFLLGLCPFIITEAFRFAFIERGYYALGGEFFTLIIPILVFMWRIYTVNLIDKENKNKK